MRYRAIWLNILPALTTVLLLGGCIRPISDTERLQQIRREALSLLTTHPADPKIGERDIPEAQWPPAIASLRPELVLVGNNNVEILAKPFFDGGWGYNVPRNKRDLPMPVSCYSEQSAGVFWHWPC